VASGSRKKVTVLDIRDGRHVDRAGRWYAIGFVSRRESTPGLVRSPAARVERVLLRGAVACDGPALARWRRWSIGLISCSVRRKESAERTLIGFDAGWRRLKIGCGRRARARRPDRPLRIPQASIANAVVKRMGGCQRISRKSSGPTLGTPVSISARKPAAGRTWRFGPFLTPSPGIR